MRKIEKVRVNLKERSYDIFIGSGILRKIGQYMKKLSIGRGVVVLSDSTVDKLYGEEVRSSLVRAGYKVDLIIIPPGEKYKSLDIVSKIFDRMVELKLERNSTMVALGGGVIGDIAGFAAATYLRGINFVQVPTTLLAQVDSSVGGKTGVNHEQGKNLIGAFYQPKLVFIDVDTLSTLKPIDVRSGMAEVIKYGIIKEAGFFKYLQKGKMIVSQYKNKKAVANDWKKIAKKSCSIKAWVVSRDEREKDLRRILNLGHTIGHALEAVQCYEGYSHGEAVGLGIIAAAKISRMLKLIKLKDENSIIDLIGSVGLYTRIKDVPEKKILKAMTLDKKVNKGKINFVLLKGIGRTVIKDNVSDKMVKNALREMRA